MTNSNEIAIRIKYDDLLYGEHSIDLLSFGESIQGLSKILSTVGEFAQSGKYVRKYSAHSVKVTTSAKLTPGSIDLTAFILAAGSGVFGALISPILQYILGRKDKAEMEHLAKALEQALAQNKEYAENAHRMQETMMRTIDKMADGLTKAASDAMSPIGKSCGTVSLYRDGETAPFVSMDKALKDYIQAQTESSVEESKTYSGVLSELDKVTGTCKITLEDDEEESRITAEILDPSFRLEKSNAYLKSFTTDVPLSFTAKALLDKDGNIVKFFISDAKIF